MHHTTWHCKHKSNKHTPVMWHNNIFIQSTHSVAVGVWGIVTLNTSTSVHSGHKCTLRCEEMSQVWGNVPLNTSTSVHSGVLKCPPKHKCKFVLLYEEMSFFFLSSQHGWISHSKITIRLYIIDRLSVWVDLVVKTVYWITDVSVSSNG
jgi:hypothetical protein